MYKFISWNVNGLRAVCGKGFADIFTELDADFFCLQETKLQEGQIDLDFLGYRSYWNYADKKGYSGTAIFSKHEPVSVTYGIGIDEHDHEGRVITLEMPDFFLVPRDRSTVLLEATCSPDADFDAYIDPDTEAFLEGEDYEGLEDEASGDEAQAGPKGASPLNFFS